MKQIDLAQNKACNEIDCWFDIPLFYSSVQHSVNKIYFTLFIYIYIYILVLSSVIFCPLASGTNKFPCLRDIKGFLILNLILACRWQVSAFQICIKNVIHQSCSTFFWLSQMPITLNSVHHSARTCHLTKN